MIGVFDPKSGQPKAESKLKTPLFFGVALLALGGAFAAGALLTKGTPKGQHYAEKAPVEAEALTLTAAVPEEPGFNLYSHEDLHPVNAAQYVRQDKLASGDTLTDLLDRLGVERSDANSALYSLYNAELIDPRKVRPGLEVTAFVEAASSEDNPDAVELKGLSLKQERDASLVVVPTSAGFQAHKLQTKLLPSIRRVSGQIDTSLYQAALDSGAYDAQVYDFAQIFAYDVDFQREIRQGDHFEIVFEELTDERGRFVRTGDILFASLDGNATSKGFYRFTPSDDEITDYFDAEGQSATKFLMKTPVNGARLSSGYGMRRHPVLGYNKMHKGTDFAAPTGTPIMAAGNGTVERASRFGSYGHYVRLRHANGYKTVYAHLHGYAKGIRKGSRVKQGDIIGYVGSTGRSTGPHLHYEVIHNGKHLNPMTLQLPTGRKLEGDHLDAFQTAKAEIDKIRGLGETETLFAAATTTEDMPSAE